MLFFESFVKKKKGRSRMKEQKALCDSIEGEISRGVMRLGLNNKKLWPASVVRICKLLKKNRVVTELDVCGNILSNKGGRCLWRVLKSNGGIKILRASDCVLGLERTCSGIADAIKCNKSLTFIDLSQNNLGGSGGKSLGNALPMNETLLVLDLSSNFLGPDGVAGLCKGLETNKTLTCLKLCNNMCVREGAEAISKALMCNKSLRELDLTNVSFTDVDMAALAKSLAANKSLEVIRLCSNHFGPQDVSQFLESLKFNASLKELDLSSNRLRSKGIKMVAECLKVNKSITRLNLAYNDIDCGSDLGEALLQNSILLALDVGSNKINGDLSSWMKSPSLTELRLERNTLTTEDVSILGQALQSNQMLRDLRLSNNNSNNVSSLVLNGRLRRLDLDGCCLHEEAVHVLAKSLNHNSTLTWLNLENNLFGTKGFDHLAAALVSNTTLRHLNVKDNIGNDFRPFFKMLRINKGLTHLNMDHTGFGLESFIDLCESLKRNTTLVSLRVSPGPMIVPLAIPLLESTMELNGSLESLVVSINYEFHQCRRNRAMHDAALRACLVLICIRKARRQELVNTPKEIVQMIAKYIWITRIDIDSWACL